jgi:hypothetical protein
MPPRPTVEDVQDIDSDDNELYEDENEEEYEGDGAGSRIKNSAQVATQQTRSLRQFLAQKTNAEITEKCRNVLNYMKTQALDLTTFLYYISWTIPETTTDSTIKFARTALMWSEELPEILENWYCPSREHGRGIRTQAGRQAMDRWAIDAVKRRMNREMRSIKHLFISPQGNLSEENLLSIDIAELCLAVQFHAPTVWSIFHSATQTPQQEAKNTFKNTDLVCVQFTSLYCTNIMRI